MLTYAHQRLAVMAAVILALPAAARGQTGILHKRGPAVIQALPSGGLPATHAAGGSMIPGAGDPSGMSHAAGVAAKPTPLPLPGGRAVPVPIDGDALVHGLPIPGAPGAAAGIGNRANASTTIGPMIPRPYGLERAASVASNFASGGLERASTATSMAAGRGVPRVGTMSPGQSGIRSVSGHAVGGTPDTSAIPPRGSPQSGAAAAAPLQRVGQVPTASGTRWRDRLRFSWSGNGE
jgi:hypothetical protein